MEIQFYKKSGELVWVQISASAIVIEDRSCILSVVRDVTAAKAAEERIAASDSALRLSEERYRTAFQTSLDAININHFKDGRYIDVNQAFLISLAMPAMRSSGALPSRWASGPTPETGRP